jgi:hypothetical protein
MDIGDYPFGYRFRDLDDSAGCCRLVSCPFDVDVSHAWNLWERRLMIPLCDAHSGTRSPFPSMLSASSAPNMLPMSVLENLPEISSVWAA